VEGRRDQIDTVSDEGIQQDFITAFDDLAREEREPANHLIGHFDYLNASGRPEAAAVRALIDGWLADYPETHRPEMIRRLRSRNDVLHSSSLFELVLHAMLLRQGFVVIEIEPELPNGRSPDFLVEAPNGTRFYLEATLALGMNDAAAGADRRMREALQAIDEVQSPDFFLHVYTRGTPSQPTAVGRLRRAVQCFVDSLDYEQAIANNDADLDTLPIWQHEEHGAHFTIQAVPKNTRRTGGRAIGGRMLPGGVIHPEVAIRSAVVGKAGRYGDIDIPLVIAVNALEQYADIDDAVDALFGTAGVIVRDAFEPEFIRNLDGAWHGLAGPIHTRCSAVLFIDRLSGWSVAQRSFHLVVNPWARYPIGPISLGVDVHEVIDRRLQTRSGQALRMIFDLPEGWPE
jgi:hypothetical protein